MEKLDELDVEELLHRKALIERQLAEEAESSSSSSDEDSEEEAEDVPHYSDKEDDYPEGDSDSDEPSPKRSCPIDGLDDRQSSHQLKQRIPVTPGKRFNVEEDVLPITPGKGLSDNVEESDSEEEEQDDASSYSSTPSSRSPSSSYSSSSSSRSSGSSIRSIGQASYEDEKHYNEDYVIKSPISSFERGEHEACLAQRLEETRKRKTNIGDIRQGNDPSQSEPIVDDVEALLEKPIDDLMKENKKNKVRKTVLEKMENDHFAPLPEGWTRITHSSGMPLYLHRGSSVVTTARPYLVSLSTSRYHNVPLSAIPCLHQKRINQRNLERARREEEQKAMDEKRESTSNPLASLRSKDITIERQEDYELTKEELTDYATKLWKFKHIWVTTNLSHEDRRNRRYEKKLEISLKSAGVAYSAKEVIENKAPGVSLINIPTPDSRYNKQSWLLNPHGKTSSTILHEYVQRALKGRILFDSEETNNVKLPQRCCAQAVVKKATRLQMTPSIKEKLAVLQEKSIGTKEVDPDEDCIILGRGSGTSKRMAKMEAAKQALEILLPELHFNDRFEASIRTAGVENKQLSDYSIHLFDLIPIDDIRVSDECTKTGQSKPYAILKEAVVRSIKWQGMKPEYKVKLVGQEKTQCTMSIGGLSATVTSCGSKNGKQRASQSLLKQMHPELESYGALLRLYSNNEEKKEQLKTRKHHEEIVRMQSSGSRLEPNLSLIEKLRKEIHEQEECRRVNQMEIRGQVFL